MRFFLPLFVLVPFLLQAEESFTLTYTGTQKWLAQEEKAPLLALRKAVEQKKQQTIYVRTPAQNPGLQLERLSIASEIISRKSNGILIKHTASNAPENQLIFTVN